MQKFSQKFPTTKTIMGKGAQISCLARLMYQSKVIMDAFANSYAEKAQSTFTNPRSSGMPLLIAM